MSMNKQELIRAIATNADVTMVAAGRMIEALNETVIEELNDTGEISLPGIGKLKLTHKPARMGVRPTDGSPIQIDARNAVKLTVAKALKDAVQ